MRLLLLTMIASMSTTMVGLPSPSAILRVLRLGIHQRHGQCQHCGMNEVTHSARLCTYCYWNLPGSRLQQYVLEQ